MTKPPPQLALTDGQTLHVTSCGTIRHSAVVPFVFAGNSRDLSIQVVDEGMNPCRACRPLTKYAKWEKFDARPDRA